MLVVMQSHATEQEVAQVLEAIKRMNLAPHPMPGATRTAIARRHGADPGHQALQVGQPGDARG